MRNFIIISPMGIANAISIFWFSSPHFGATFWISSLLGAQNYVYKFWLSLYQSARIFIFCPPPLFFLFFGRNFLKQKLSEITSSTTLLITEFVLELYFWSYFYNFRYCSWELKISVILSLIISSELDQINMGPPLR